MLYWEMLLHTHPNPQKMDKKVVNKPNCLSPNVNELLAFGQTVFGFMYAHHLNKINEQKVVSKPNHLLLNVIEFSKFDQTIFGFLYAHYTRKTLSKPNCLLPNMVFHYLVQQQLFFVCVHSIYNYINQLIVHFLNLFF